MEFLGGWFGEVEQEVLDWLGEFQRKDAKNTKNAKEVKGRRGVKR
jgi:hypothetical protein